MPESVLAATEIHKAYGDQIAVNRVSLSIGKGEILGLLGPNGAGKTTLARVLVGLLDPDFGKMSYFGREASPRQKNVKRQISIVPQEPSFYMTFTVEQNLLFFASIYGLGRSEAREKADYLIKWLKLTGFRHKRAELLSGGYKRLLNIACSLVNDPKLVFLDEPTVGLDPKMRQLLWDKIIELKNQGRTILLTTHYMDEAEKLCDRVALMSDGRISVIESPYRLIEKFGGETILIFKLDKSVDQELIEKVQQAMPGITPRSVQSNLVLPVKQADSTKAIVKISKLVEESGYKILGSIVKEPELEDVFLNITGSAMGV
ncbi:MAG: ABC transporter ATP-binding protein [Candidatus Diapherotrites archaeon]|uniref:ABC transporter ATP-binding protein n=1 Tax=Candidatus Iainarchaeum sp. TaxID=3101447 RepID=A0A939C4D9_9ARCH|nr:ABC transporter ATP-binding protein [Candidatus Diapherotrites archaeon]